MILEQHYLGCLAQASYLIVDETSKVALVADPRRDVDLYLERAEDLGARIEHVLLTHFHADFLAGHLELAERTGATIHLGAGGQAEYAFEALADGQELVLGPEVRIVALETPGHTPESVCYVVYDASVDAEVPHAVLTGDTLFIGDVGRPDLMASVGFTADELAGCMYDSLHEKLLSLPDETLVYPAHGAGSACGKNLSTDTVSTIGQQKALNYALQPMSKEEFVAQLTAEQPPAPAYFPVTAGLNKREHSTLDAVLAEALRPMDPDALLAAQRDGAQVLDVRDKDDVAAAHLAGSIAIGLDGDLASWAGSVLDLEAPIVIVADPGRELEAATRLGRVGLDRVLGYLRGGPAALAERGELGARVARVDVATAAAELGGDDPPLVLDVRAPGEVARARVEDSRAIPLGQLAGRAHELPRERRVFVHCKTGYRSLTACTLLQRAGLDPERVVDVEGGLDAWSEAGLPGLVGEACPT